MSKEDKQENKSGLDFSTERLDNILRSSGCELVDLDETGEDLNEAWAIFFSDPKNRISSIRSKKRSKNKK